MKLFFSAASPYVRKVMVVLHETGQLGDVEIVPVTNTPIEPADQLASNNPLSKVPALVRPDGPTLFDSRVICAFLDDRGKGGLYPSGAGRWDTLTLEALGDGILDAALSITYEARFRPEGMRSDSWTDGQWVKIARACSALNERWMSHLAGPLDMGQIAVACALGYVDLRHDARGWRKGHDGLAAWYATFDERASQIATRPPTGV